MGFRRANLLPWIMNEAEDLVGKLKHLLELDELVKEPILNRHDLSQTHLDTNLPVTDPMLLTAMMQRVDITEKVKPEIRPEGIGWCPWELLTCQHHLSAWGDHEQILLEAVLMYMENKEVIWDSQHIVTKAVLPDQPSSLL
uniref:Proteasome activator PA28 N-terminal domain-containing protein n=1 Tax=Ficedula albicollis TaxID=59894 RepID=A0A803WAI8_FICAL